MNSNADPWLRRIPIVLLTATRYTDSDDETRGGLKPMEVLKLVNLITSAANSEQPLYRGRRLMRVAATD